MIASPSTDRTDEPAVVPPDEKFWKTYNSRLEFPIAALLSLLAHVALIAVLVFLLVVAMAGGEDKSSVPLRLVDNGDAEEGLGNKNAIGKDEPLTPGDTAGPTLKDVDALPLEDSLPEVQKDFQEKIQLDPDLAETVVTPEKAAAYASLNDVLRDQILPVGQRKGNGGTEAGEAGIGSDATKARSLRWVMRFRTNNGRDYLNQLSALGAIVIVPVPPENKAAYVFRDLVNPKVGNLVSEGEWQKLAQQIQFCDFKQDSVAQVSAELGLAQTKPHMFWAFFPKVLEDQLAKKEREYQNRSPDSVSETVFQVVQKGGRFDLDVVRQTLK
ncbi:MAG: hypothetical protein ACRC7O_19420 [Fimbriiglobus sp.]